MPKQTYKAHPEGEQRRRVLRELIEAVLLVPLDDKYKRKVLNDLLWKYTEADGKYNTRHRSVAASEYTSNHGLRHDHVFTKKELIGQLMEPSPTQVHQILERAIGCVVTKDEHTALSRFDRKHSGWERYRQAGIEYLS